MTYVSTAPVAAGTDELLQLKKLEELRGKILKHLTERRSVKFILNEIALGVERAVPGATCAILLVSEDGKTLTVGAAPTMPGFYIDAIDGMAIRIGSTSCASAAASGNRVISADIAANPLWEHHRRVALKAGYASCFSDPVLGENGSVIATFAIYKSRSGLPALSEVQAFDYASPLVGLSVERDLMQRELTDHRSHLDDLVERRAQDLVKRNAELEATTREALRTNKAKSRFLATMSHEIRTPLNGITPVVHLLSQTDLSPEQARHVKTLKFASRALLDVVNQFLDWHRIESNEVILNTSSFEIGELLDEVRNIFQISASAKNLKLSIDTEQEIKHRVIGDKIRIRQILSNLVGNAIKFTREGFIQIGCNVSSQDEETVSLEIWVKDSGKGIKPEDQHRIFEKFEQTTEGAAQGSSGTGLGLAISRALAEAMDGRIDLDSTYGNGSTFTLALRLPKETGTTARPRPIPPAETAPQAPDKTLSILLADDNPINTTIISAMLTRSGHTVRVANNGLFAVKLARTREFDLILMDVNMPEMDGLEATRIIRALSGKLGNIPILALTAGLMPDQVQKCLSAGMNDVLPKPISIDDLNSAIGKLARMPDAGT